MRGTRCGETRSPGSSSRTLCPTFLGDWGPRGRPGLLVQNLDGLGGEAGGHQVLRARHPQGQELIGVPVLSWQAEDESEINELVRLPAEYISYLEYQQLYCCDSANLFILLSEYSESA